MKTIKEELKAKIDGVLSEEKYLQRTVDQIARCVEEDPSTVLRFCRKHTGYNLSFFKNDIFVALTDRVNEAMEAEEEKFVEAMKGGEEEEDGPKQTARLQPIRSRPKPKTDWQAILHNLSHMHLVLTRTIRMIPACEKKALVQQAERDLETVYAAFSKKTFNSIE